MVTLAVIHCVRHVSVLPDCQKKLSLKNFNCSAYLPLKIFTVLSLWLAETIMAYIQTNDWMTLRRLASLKCSHFMVHVSKKIPHASQVVTQHFVL